MESKERIVARCSEGISPLRYVWRIGMEAANSSPQTTISPITAQNFSKTPISTRVTELDERGGQERRGATAEQLSDPGRGEASDDLRTRDDRRHEPGDPVGLRVPVQLQQVRLRA